jgi:large subunit ribosomal protein L22
MPTSTHTNEREGTRAVLRHFHMSASKARQVLELIRGVDAIRAQEILASTPREAAGVISKVLASAIANAVNNDGLAAEELFVATAYADEGPTAKRFRPRARGRASRIRKRTCHITIVVARMDAASLARARTARSADGSARSRRVAGSRRRADQQSHAHRREVEREEAAEALAVEEAATDAADAAVDEAMDADESDGADAGVATQDASAPEGDEHADATDAQGAVEQEADPEATAAGDAAHDAASKEKTD